MAMPYAFLAAQKLGCACTVYYVDNLGSANMYVPILIVLIVRCGLPQILASNP